MQTTSNLSNSNDSSLLNKIADEQIKLYQKDILNQVGSDGSFISSLSENKNTEDVRKSRAEYFQSKINKPIEKTKISSELIDVSVISENKLNFEQSNLRNSDKEFDQKETLKEIKENDQEKTDQIKNDQNTSEVGSVEKANDEKSNIMESNELKNKSDQDLNEKNVPQYALIEPNVYGSSKNFQTANECKDVKTFEFVNKNELEVNATPIINNAGKSSLFQNISAKNPRLTSTQSETVLAKFDEKSEENKTSNLTSQQRYFYQLKNKLAAEKDNFKSIFFEKPKAKLVKSKTAMENPEVIQNPSNNLSNVSFLSMNKEKTSQFFYPDNFESHKSFKNKISEKKNFETSKENNLASHSNKKERNSKSGKQVNEIQDCKSIRKNIFLQTKSQRIDSNNETGTIERSMLSQLNQNKTKTAFDQSVIKCNFGNNDSNKLTRNLSFVSNNKTYRKTGVLPPMAPKIEDCFEKDSRFFQKYKESVSHRNYLEYLHSELTKIEHKKIDYRQQIAECDRSIDILKREIYKSEVKMDPDLNMDCSNVDLIVKTSKERFIRQKKVISAQKKVEEECQQNKKSALEKENQISERLNSAKKQRIIENINKIQQRAVIRKKRNELANKLLAAIKSINCPP